MDFFSLGQTSFCFVQEYSSHNLQWLSVQNHLYTVLYDNAVVSFPSLVIDDTQGLTSSVRQITHTHTFLSQGEKKNCEIFPPGSTFPETPDRNTTFISIIGAAKIENLLGEEGRDQLAGVKMPPGDIRVRMFPRKKKHPGQFSCVSMAALPLCFTRLMSNLIVRSELIFICWGRILQRTDSYLMLIKMTQLLL